MSSKTPLLLESDIAWLKQVIQFRLSENFGTSNVGDVQEKNITQVDEILPLEPDTNVTSGYATFIRDYKLSFDERLLLILAMANHIDPSVLPFLFNKSSQNGLQPLYSLSIQQTILLGRVEGSNADWFLPTGLTFLFIRGGKDYRQRLAAQQVFFRNSVLAEKRVVLLEPHLKGEPTLSGRLTVAEDYIDLFTVGQQSTGIHCIKYPDYVLE